MLIVTASHHEQLLLQKSLTPINRLQACANDEFVQNGSIQNMQRCSDHLAWKGGIEWLFIGVDNLF